ncbi:NTPase [Candidatus Bathyarchaeota archaeon]|nr:NTPase [Candidatus Bathyarchaeota archaeon]
MKVIFLTGEAGVGKTTIVVRLCDHFSSGIEVQGITTREVRDGGARVGFRIMDVATREEGWLARKDRSQGARVGSYRVVEEDLERIGVAALDRAIDGSARIVVVDEIGPMEMTSLKFRQAVARLFDSDRPIIATVKQGSRYPEIERVRSRGMELEITRVNREECYEKLVAQVEEWMRSLSG